MTEKFSVVTYTINPPKFLHPSEDAFKISKKYPIYAVADGVTLEIKRGEKYPLLPNRKISGPKMAAEIFCQEAVEFLERNYPKLQEKPFDKFRVYLKQAFQKVNQSIFNFNQKYESDFSTVASLTVICGGYLFGGRLTDCGLAVIDKKGIRFKTPEFWQTRGRREMLKEMLEAGLAKRQFIGEHVINNPKIKDSSGRKIGYGVLNGQKQALEFIDFYQVPLKENDVIIIYSDGFESYFNLKEFIDLFSFWQDFKKTKEKLKVLSEKTASDNYKLYGLERTLIAIKLI